MDQLVQGTSIIYNCIYFILSSDRISVKLKIFFSFILSKTESVKALGAQLGRFVLVFNCDETFDFGAMGRLLAGLSQVGAWGCFDEFNRLEERILSAVSQQILTIQRGLIERRENIELLGRAIKLHESVAVFITMNPGYVEFYTVPPVCLIVTRIFLTHPRLTSVLQIRWPQQPAGQPQISV